ncbi:MAG: hypothetical protein WD068_02825 [Candidatus Babeliales bacterium]
MKKFLLSLLVGFSSVAVATDTATSPETAPKASWTTAVSDKACQAWNGTKTHFSNNWKKWAIGTPVVGAAAFGLNSLYRNPKAVRAIKQTTSKYSRQGLNVVKARKGATVATIATIAALALGYKYQAQLEGYATKAKTSVVNAYTNRPAWMFNKKADTKAPEVK